MGSESPVSLAEDVDVMVDASVDGHGPTKKSRIRVPKRVHKAEREKLKREHLNELFLGLANAIELDQLNNGKACMLNEATRLLKDLFSQIESLRKENASLLSESHYVTIEQNELREETSALESQIEVLQSELEARVAYSKPDFNVPPPEFQQPELTSQFPGDNYGLPTAAAVEPALPQVPAVLVVPLHSDFQAYSTPDATRFASKLGKVSKPHARYPNPVDSWPSQLLGGSISNTRENGPTNI